MIYEVLAPNLGQSGMPVRIEKWMKKEGEKVEKGEVLFELSNEKLSQEVEALEAGTVIKIFVEEGSEAMPQEIIAHIETE